MQVWSELGRSAGTKDGNPFLFFHLENPMHWEYTMVTVCVRQDCSDLTQEISLERVLYTYTYAYTYTYQISHSVVSDPLRPHESHFTRLPCPSPTPGVHKNICSLRRWCHPAISSSVIPFSCWSKSLLSENFMSQFYAWGGQCTGVSALASVPPKSIQD